MLIYNYQRQVYIQFLFIQLAPKIEPMIQKKPCDRFIPVRSHKDTPYESCFSTGKQTEASTNYSRVLSPESSKYLKFATPCNTKTQSITDFIFKSVKKKQNIVRDLQVRKASRILDAPDVTNNFYINPLDWSSSNKRIGIALAESAYLLGQAKDIYQFQRFSSIPITCLKFFHEGLCLLGEDTGRIQVYDTQSRKRIRNVNIHYNRIGIISQSDFPEAFLSGSKDRLIKLNDLRIKKTDVAVLQKHKGQICGLSTVNHYLASGGNDNRVIIWDLRKLKPINQINQYKSAVKAIAWCPWKTCLLATGGGNNDKRIILWNGNKNSIQMKIETESQITALQWKQQSKQLISGHYTGKKSHCIIWSGSTPEIKLKGHTGRLLGMKLNPFNRNQLCTISSDQTLRFWDIKYEKNVGKDPRKQCNFKQPEFEQNDFRLN